MKPLRLSRSGQVLCSGSPAAAYGLLELDPPVKPGRRASVEPHREIAERVGRMRGSVVQFWEIAK
jgi:hypothetical protein